MARIKRSKMSQIADISVNVSADQFYTATQLSKLGILPYHSTHIRYLMREDKLPCRRLSARRVGMFGSDILEWQEAVKAGREWKKGSA